MKILSILFAVLGIALILFGADPAHADSGIALAAAGASPLLAGTAAGAVSVALEFGRKKDDGGGGNADPVDAGDFKKLTTDVKDALKQVQDFATKAADQLKKGEELTADQKSKIDAAMTKLNLLDEIKGRVDEIEQKAARGGGGEQGPVSAGSRFVEADEFKSFAGQTRPRGRVIVEVKDISSLTTDAAGSVGTLVQPQRAAPVTLPQRRMTIRALLAPGTTSSSSIEYDKETGFTNNAAVVAEGTLKPQSEIQYEEAISHVRTVAHWMRASVQILADAPALRSIIDNRLRYGLAVAEEAELLTGSGTGQHLSGLITEATAYAAPGGLVDTTMIDRLRIAMLQVYLAEYPPNGIVLNPIDWTFIELMKDELGRYLLGNPGGSPIDARLWGLPVVPTQAMGVDKFLVGAFDLAAQIFDRQDATVEASTEDQDNFVKNKVTIRAEERLALAIYRPEALVYGDLGRVA